MHRDNSCCGIVCMTSVFSCLYSLLFLWPDSFDSFVSSFSNLNLFLWLSCVLLSFPSLLNSLELRMELKTYWMRQGRHYCAAWEFCLSFLPHIIYVPSILLSLLSFLTAFVLKFSYFLFVWPWKHALLCYARLDLVNQDYPIHSVAII